MGSEKKTQLLTQVEFEESDFPEAEKIARRLGYTQTAYTSSSALWGLFCLPDRPTQRKGCIIKTLELGMLFVQDSEDLLMKSESFGPRCGRCGDVKILTMEGPHKNIVCSDCAGEIAHEEAAHGGGL